MAVGGEHDEGRHNGEVLLVWVSSHDFASHREILFELLRPRTAELTETKIITFIPKAPNKKMVLQEKKS